MNPPSASDISSRFSLGKLRADARQIFFAGLAAADPVQAICRHVRRDRNILEVSGRSYDLASYRKLYVIGAGKGAAKMAAAIRTLTGDVISEGIVIVKYGYLTPVPKITVIEAGHPIPDVNGLDASAMLTDLLGKTTRDDLVICLISGGASALLISPSDGLSLEDKQEANRLLLSSGAAISDINAVRKHISNVKGGRLAQLAAPSTVISLILSDVIGDSIETIGSGPTAADLSTFADCERILQRFGLWKKMPVPVRDLMTKGVMGEIGETPKLGDPAFERVQNVIVGNNELALARAKQEALTLGYNAAIFPEFRDGDATDLAIAHAALAKQIVTDGEPIKRPACVISGGETTVTLTGDGLGGRNQEFALAAAIELSGVDRVVVLSAGTDGTDGPTEAAGGVVDGNTILRGEGLDPHDYLARNDSYHFLRYTGDLLVTGPTFTNVMDLRLILIG